MMKILKKIAGCIFLFFVVTVVVGAIAVCQIYRFWIQAPNVDSEVQVVNVYAGEGLSDVATMLDEEGLIANAFWFKWYGRLDGAQKNIQVGEFELSEGMNYASIVDTLTRADDEEIQITIPEGYTLDQIGGVVMENFDVTEAEWGVLTGMESPFESHEFVVAAQKPEDVDLEGYLFPDTYRFFADASGEDVVERMLNTMQSRVEENDITPPDGWTMHEMLTLASILEREVRGAEDKAMVADIFYKRLDIGMALQADSTVNYVTGKDTPSISLADRDIDSPYNTYLYPGLPPGPISNPGLESLEALTRPIPNDYFYFLTNEEGEVIYSVTHDSHVQNKAIHLP